MLHLLLIAAFLSSCKHAKSKIREGTLPPKGIVQMCAKHVAVAKTQTKANPLDFIPKGYNLFSRCEGDLNKDGLPDVVLMIKGTEKSKWVDDAVRGRLDRNRRGLIILFKCKGGYEHVLENDTCFSSENEDGGISDPPELELDISKNTLQMYYAHDQYGYWNYTFRYKKGDFELIGYYHNRCIRHVTYYNLDVNFSTRTRVYEENLNADDNDADENFKVTKTKVKGKSLIKLSQIADFDKLNWGDFSEE